jgi:small redox-active disulfide protein 2
VSSSSAKTQIKERKMDIKVLGPGCPKCQQTERIVKEAVAESGVQASVEKVTDTMEIAGYGVFGTPAVVVEGEVKSVGKIPNKSEVLAWLKP